MNHSTAPISETTLTNSETTLTNSETTLTKPAKRSLTVYVIRHAQDAPIAVRPTISAANAYLTDLAADNDGHPICEKWHIEPRKFPDNSTGAADLMCWLLGECADELIRGHHAMHVLEQLNHELAIPTPEAPA